LDASYDPPVNHIIDEIRSDLKLIKSIHQKKRKTERIEKVRTEEVYAAGEREKNRERKHAQKKRMKVRQTHSAQINVNASQRCGLVNLGASCFLNAVLQCLLSCPLPLPQEPEENSFTLMFCNLALEMRQQTGVLNASSIYYALPGHFRPGQQDASDLFHYLTTTCSLFEIYFSGIATHIENYPQCRLSNMQKDLHPQHEKTPMLNFNA